MFAKLQRLNQYFLNIWELKIEKKYKVLGLKYKQLKLKG